MFLIRYLEQIHILFRTSSQSSNEFSNHRTSFVILLPVRPLTTPLESNDVQSLQFHGGVASNHPVQYPKPICVTFVFNKVCNKQI
jgi:hypothetical protein